MFNVVAYQRAWMKQHPEKAKQYRDTYRAKNHDKYLAAQRVLNIRNKAKYADYRLQRKHGITLGDKILLISQQDGRCAICKTKATKFHVDHNHKTNTVRSLLCETCNVGLGSFQDNAMLLLAASEYIKTWMHHTHKGVK